MREDRVIMDYDTGQMLKQGEMLRQLMTRTGIGRNNWHEQAEKLAGKNWESKSRLSDIFSGKRPLPLKDVIPLIDALRLPLKETNHYCCEFFRANVPSNLQRYIKPNVISKRIAIMQIYNDDLKALVENLQAQLAYDRYVETLPMEHNLKEKIEQQQASIVELKQEIYEFKKQMLSQKEQKLLKEFSEEKITKQERDCLMMEIEHDRLILNHQYIEEPEYAQLGEQFAHEHDALQKSMLNEELSNMHRSLYQRRLKSAVEDLGEIYNSGNNLLSDQISCFFPANFADKLDDFFNQRYTSEYENDVSSWLWIKTTFRSRLKKYIEVSLFGIWKELHPEDYELSKSYYQRLFTKNYTDGERLSLSQLSTLRKTNIEDEKKYRDSVEKSFSTFINKLASTLRNEYPSLWELINPINSFEHPLNWGNCEIEVFSRYINFLKQGFISKFDLLEFNETTSPSVNASQNIFKIMAAIIVTNEAEAQTIIGKRRFTPAFKCYGDAHIKYSSPVDFLLKNCQEFSTLDELYFDAIGLIESQIQQGLTVFARNEFERLGDMAPFMLSLGFNPHC